MSSDYYKALRVPRHAKEEQLKEAYRKLVMRHHPDRGGNTEAFQKIQEAYQVLSDPALRKNYDSASLGEDQYTWSDFVHEGCELPKDLDSLNLYDYFNAFFKLKESQKIGPGQYYDKDDMRQTASCALSALKGDPYFIPKDMPSANIWERRKHIKKLNELKEFIFGGDFTQRLYNISLGHYENNEDRKVANALGDVAIIKKIFSLTTYFPHEDFAKSVFVLNKTSLLNPQNFDKLAKKAIIDKQLESMRQTGILTQSNFDILLSDSNIRIMEIFVGIRWLINNKILNQTTFMQVVHAKRRGCFVAASLIALNKFNLHTPETESVALNKIMSEALCEDLEKIKTTLPKTNLLHWSPVEPFTDLAKGLNHLFAHGLFLLTIKPLLGEAVMTLAMELKQELRNYADSCYLNDAIEKTRFLSNFTKKLHSQDKTMSIHRAQWKYLLTNIMIALTGIGLIALGCQYVTTKKGFFSQTTRQKSLQKIEQDAQFACREIKRSTLAISF